MKHLELRGRGGSIISTVEGPLFFAQRINPFPILERGRGGGVSWLYC